MKRMNLATHATEPLALLIGVLAKFGADFKRKLLDAGTDALGIKITAEDFPNIERIVEPDGAVAGWFGYESNPPLGPRLSVWFYCSSSTGTKAGAQDRIKDTLRKAGFQDKDFRDDGSSVYVICRAEGSSGDAEW